MTIRMPPPYCMTVDTAVVGGGIAGLCLAIAMIKQGMRVTVYESIRNYREIGAGIAFGPNALRAMELIDPRIRAIIDRIGMSGSKDGVIFHARQGMTTPDWKFGDHVAYSKCSEPLAGVTRAAFLEEVLKLIPDDVICYSKRVTGLEKSARGRTCINFKDGTHAEHDLVIGCDGIHSIVRKHVLGADNPDSYPRFSGKICHRGIVDMADVVRCLGEAPADKGTIYLGHGGHIVTFPVANGTKMSIGGFACRDKWESPEWVKKTSKEEMEADYQGWGKNLVDLLGHVQQTDMWAVFDLPYGETYVKGNVVLMGDAAHASTPFQGSGSSMALEDAYILAELVSRISRPEELRPALKAYDAVRRPRSQKLVRTSIQSGAMLDYEDPDFGTDIERIGKNIEQRWNWIWYEDLEGELEQAITIMREAN